MSKAKKFSLDQVVDPSAVTVADVGILSLSIDKSVRVDEFPSKLSFISNLNVSFYMHLEHSLGFVTSIPVILRVEDFTDDYLSALDNVRLNNASLEVIDEPSMIFFTFDRDNLVDCASLFELGSLESNFDNDNDRFLLTPKNALAGELMGLVQSKLNIENIDEDNADVGYDADFFDSLKSCLKEDLSLLHEESAVHVSDISLTEEADSDKPQDDSKSPVSQSKKSNSKAVNAEPKDETQPAEDNDSNSSKDKGTTDAKDLEKKEVESVKAEVPVEPTIKKEISDESAISKPKASAKPKSIKDPSVSNPLAAASAIIGEKAEPESIHEDLFNVNDPKDVSVMDDPLESLREPDGY